MLNLVSDLNICNKKGLSERFDSTIGAGTVLMPFGGKTQMTPAQAMVAKIPLTKGQTTTVTGMAYGFHPEFMAASCYEGAYLSVVESLARLAATGFDTTKAYLTFQEYFERLSDKAEKWGKPMAALLGALDAQLDFEVAAIGGKDSMSGTFEDLDVPPTLVSFAVSSAKDHEVISPEFKGYGNNICILKADSFDKDSIKKNFKLLHEAILEKRVISAWAIGLGGAAEAVFKMGLGNKIGANITKEIDLFSQDIGSFVIEMNSHDTLGELIGETTASYTLHYLNEVSMSELLEDAYTNKLAGVFPYNNNDELKEIEKVSFDVSQWNSLVLKHKPKAFIPTFPGTNCEIDTFRALEQSGADPEILLINNLSPMHIEESLKKAKELIKQSNMIVLPGGFSGGDEPEGSAKFINAFFRNPSMMEAIDNFLNVQDGLMLGICNGFQALVKLGLLPYGKIVNTTDKCPTLTFNTIGRHQSMMCTTRIASNKSPWLMDTKVGDEHTVAISHGEGRFIANDETIASLIKNGQIATQYVDLNSNPTYDLRYNPNGSVYAIEGITSADGRILGKMGHTERSGNGLYKNIYGNTYQPLFTSGVKYFK